MELLAGVYVVGTGESREETSLLSAGQPFEAVLDSFQDDFIKCLRDSRKHANSPPVNAL